MRNIFVVVSDIIYTIRNDKSDHKSTKFILQDLESLYESMHYSSPEQIKSVDHFERLQEIMNYYIDQDDYIYVPWCKKVINIFLDPEYGN